MEGAVMKVIAVLADWCILSFSLLGLWVGMVSVGLWRRNRRDYRRLLSHKRKNERRNAKLHTILNHEVTGLN